MPNLLIPIPVTYDPITRRVAKSVIDNVMKITQIPENYRVELRGDLNVATQPGGELGDTGPMNRFAQQGRVIVVANETYRDSEVINAATRDVDAQPIFVDEKIGVLIKPVYSYTDMTLQFTYRAKDKMDADMFTNDIKARLADNRQQHLHELTYHYPVPVWCASLLREIYTKREAVGGFGQSLGAYLQEKYTKRATVVAPQSSDVTKGVLVIAEHQVGVQGWFDFIEPEQAEKNEEGATWIVGFQYKFNYKKPIEVNVQYPLMVHNQLIDARFIPKPQKDDPDRKFLLRGEFKFALDTFDYAARLPPKPLGGIMIPDFDEWIPEQVPNFTTTLVTWIAAIEPKDLTLFFNEQDVLNTGFHPSILAYMRRMGDKLLTRGQAALHFCLYRGVEPIYDGDLEFRLTDRAFEIRSKSIPDIRQNYHMRLSFCTNIRLYPYEALEELSRDGMTTLRMFQTVVNRLDVEDAQANHMSEEGELSIAYIKRFFKMLYNQAVGWHNQPTPGNINNNVVDKGAYELDDLTFFGGFDRPYVEVLTVLSDRRQGVSDASTIPSH